MKIHRQWGDNRWMFERERKREIRHLHLKSVFFSLVYTHVHIRLRVHRQKKWHAPLNCCNFACTVHWALQSDWTGSTWRKAAQMSLHFWSRAELLKIMSKTFVFTYTVKLPAAAQQLFLFRKYVTICPTPFVHLIKQVGWEKKSILKLLNFYTV